MLGIITACNEWSQRTALIPFTQEPRRLRVVLAKLLSVAALGTITVALAWVMALVAFLILAAWVDVNAALTPLAEGLDLTGTPWAQVGSSGLLWIGIPLVIGIWRVLTREVK